MIYHDGQEMYNRLLELTSGTAGEFINQCNANAIAISDVRRDQSGSVLIMKHVQVRHSEYTPPITCRIVYNRFGFYMRNEDPLAFGGPMIEFPEFKPYLTGLDEFVLGLGEAKRKLDGLLTCFDHIR